MTLILLFLKGHAFTLEIPLHRFGYVFRNITVEYLTPISNGASIGIYLMNNDDTYSVMYEGTPVTLLPGMDIIMSTRYREFYLVLPVLQDVKITYDLCTNTSILPEGCTFRSTTEDNEHTFQIMGHHIMLTGSTAAKAKFNLSDIKDRSVTNDELLSMAIAHQMSGLEHLNGYMLDNYKEPLQLLVSAPNGRPCDYVINRNTCYPNTEHNVYFKRSELGYQQCLDIIVCRHADIIGDITLTNLSIPDDMLILAADTDHPGPKDKMHIMGSNDYINMVSNTKTHCILRYSTSFYTKDIPTKNLFSQAKLSYSSINVNPTIFNELTQQAPHRYLRGIVGYILQRYSL